MFDILNS